MTELQTLHQVATDLRKNSPEVLRHSEVRRALEQRLIQDMIWSMADGDPVEARNAYGQHVKIMHRLEHIL
jgi:hypothetical protein